MAQEMLVTLAELKAKMELTTTDDDAWLTNEIQQMSAIVNTYCERTFVRDNAKIEQFDLYEETYLYLNLYPVVSITSLSIDGAAVDLGTDPSPIYLDRKAGRLSLREGTLCGSEVIDIEYVAGYENINVDTTGVPDDVKRVILDLVQSRYFNRGAINDPTRRLRSESIPDVANFIYERSKAFDDEPLLGPYAHILDKWRSVKAVFP